MAECLAVSGSRDPARGISEDFPSTWKAVTPAANGTDYNRSAIPTICYRDPFWAQFAVQNTNRLRLSGFAGKVSLIEVEIYNRTDPPLVVVGSDLLNHIIGIVNDAFRTLPSVSAAVQIGGTAGGKLWEATAETDENGVFQVEMPVGLSGNVTATAKLPSGDSPQRTLQAGDLTPGLSLPDDGTAAIDLDGVWRFKPDPNPVFYRTDFSDADWKDIKVPSHWVMEGASTATPEPADIAAICRYPQTSVVGASN